ncbi:MAG: DEAD/DEAH box helicase family protein, partial [Bacteroidales bacterium]|nr:DEAD/DEAH box helicase family protein [Bacteroidales bacterium]
MAKELPLQLAEELSKIVNLSFESGEMMSKVTPTTAELLRFWFMEPFTDERAMNFHIGQKQAILNIIYLHEIVGVSKVIDIYSHVMPDQMPLLDLSELSHERFGMPKYAVKMATGTGKTWVMMVLMIWQILNARHEEQGNRFTKNFLIVAPGLVVYDRLQDAFLGRLQSATGCRDIRTNDFYASESLFIPPAYRDEIHSFVANNVVTKEDGIGRKATGEGLIALTNWHLFLKNNAENNVDDDSIESVIDDLLPLRPGTSGGNALDTLDSQYLRGNEMEYLAELSNLMVINDEAHHIHENEDDAVKWQQGLDKIFANKKDDCYQVDFSATPFTSQGSGKKSRKNYFPHIVVDFDLVTAMRMGLVKTLLLDKRQELTDLSTLDYSAVRDGKRVIGLSEGQRLMLRAGLKKLKLLEEGFMRLDERKCPKMLVMCEDTQVSPHVANFLTEEGLDNEDILQIDSSKQGELKETEWARVKEKLFNIDRYSRPKVIVSVLMLREGFDVSNICVIVPLRSSTAPILLEQTIGRGLRLMWREPEYQEEKQENRINVLQKKLAPKSYIDMLTIIEHPVFEEFYKDLMEAGLAGEDTEDMTPVQP